MALPGGDILIVGLGASGVAAASYLTGLDDGQVRRVTAVDSHDTPSLRETAQVLEEQGVEVRLGVDGVEESYALGVVSPGVPPSAAVFRSASEHSGELISEIELAYRVSNVPWVAVTGTNGKTTTTSLIAHILREGGVVAETAGNIGRPAIAVAAQTNPPAVIVAEVSSFQLATTTRFHPRVSVLLNITPDHLDWHGSMDTYIADKGAIFANQDEDDTAVIGMDNAESAAFLERVEEAGTKTVAVSVSSVRPDSATIGGDVLILPTAEGSVPLVTRDELGIKGEHNIANSLAAAAAALACGVRIEDIREGLKSFEPIEHRLEPISVLAGVEYVNDSKATNPDATMKALTAFPERPLILLLGGRNKGSAFDELAQEVVDRCKAAITFGEAGEEIARSLRGAGGSPIECDGMIPALHEACARATEGDVVLLSPACASFDEFRSYIDRGNVFRKEVERLVEADPNGG